jgi:protoporphyrinogen oxidase
MISADWAAQRIKNLSLTKAVWNALTGSNDTASLIEKFKYPRLGPGMMWERCTKKVIENGGEVRMNTKVVQVNRDGNRITSIDLKSWDVDADAASAEKTERFEADEFVNTMAMRDLIQCIQPPPPQPVIDAANRLKYRDFMIVTLVLNVKDPFPDNWIYIHSPQIRCGRIQNFRAWSPEMLPDQTTASIGMEYFCKAGDDLWMMEEKELTELASRELEELGLAPADSVIGSAIIRQPKAYPVYDDQYQEALAVIRRWIETLENFQTVGRNGLHRYNNQDHSMLSAMLAARNILGEDHNVWDVNVERSYHEEFQIKDETHKRSTAPSTA